MYENKCYVDGKYDLVVVHVDKSIGLVRQLVALCDVAVPGVIWLIIIPGVTWPVKLSTINLKIQVFFTHTG